MTDINDNIVKIQGLCCFIIPYFGKLPDTIDVFFKTCANNNEYNWIIFTDDENPYKYPENVKIIFTSFNEIKERIQNCFSFKIALDSPKKLCDFKPAYGFIFEKELRNFRYWGYCDLDQYFGSLDHFIPSDFLEKYDKLFSLGHMTIYRNVTKINKLFMQQLNYDNFTNKSYIEVFSKKQNLLFDEWPRTSVNINDISRNERINSFHSDSIDDVVPNKSKFINTIFQVEKREWIIDSIGSHVIVWNNGNIYAAWINDDKTIEFKELLYAHIQKRKFKIVNYNQNLKSFIIYPNKIRFLDCNSLEEMKPYIKRYIKFSNFRSKFMPDEIAKNIEYLVSAFLRRIRKFLIN